MRDREHHQLASAAAAAVKRYLIIFLTIHVRPIAPVSLMLNSVCIYVCTMSHLSADFDHMTRANYALRRLLIKALGALRIACSAS